MNEELLGQILRTNNIFGDLKSSFLGIYNVMKENAVKNNPNAYVRHILYPVQLKEMLVYEKILFHELSNLLGKDVYITNEQFREFLCKCGKVYH